MRLYFVLSVCVGFVLGAAIVLFAGCSSDYAAAVAWDALGATGAPPAVRYVDEAPAPRAACQYYPGTDLAVVMRTPRKSDGSLVHELLHGWQWRRGFEDRDHLSIEWKVDEPRARTTLKNAGE